MSLSLIRTEYKTILETVANIGIVHDYARLATDWKKFLEFFKTNIGGVEMIRGWEISRESSPEEEDFISGVSPNAIVDRSHVMLIRGYAGLQDASATEKTFQDLIEAILTTFRPLHTLNGQAIKTRRMRVDLVTEREFGGVLCHYAELRQLMWERVNY